MSAFEQYEPEAVEPSAERPRRRRWMVMAIVLLVLAAPVAWLLIMRSAVDDFLAEEPGSGGDAADCSSGAEEWLAQVRGPAQFPVPTELQPVDAAARTLFAGDRWSVVDTTVDVNDPEQRWQLSYSDGIFERRTADGDFVGRIGPDTAVVRSDPDSSIWIAGCPNFYLDFRPSRHSTCIERTERGSDVIYRWELGEGPCDNPVGAQLRLTATLTSGALTRWTFSSSHDGVLSSTSTYVVVDDVPELSMPFPLLVAPRWLVDRVAGN